jgi:hypothetical protein
MFFDIEANSAVQEAMERKILASISAKHESASKSMRAECTRLQAKMDTLDRKYDLSVIDKRKVARDKKFNDIQVSKFWGFDYIFIMLS